MFTDLDVRSSSAHLGIGGGKGGKAGGGSGAAGSAGFLPKLDSPGGGHPLPHGPGINAGENRRLAEERAAGGGGLSGG